MQEIQTRVENEVTFITFNRPAQLNALTPEMLEYLVELPTTLRNSSSRIVVIEGHGKTFCAGADLMSFGPAFLSNEAEYIADLGRRAVEAIESIEQLTIAQIQGVCIGGGLVLAAACDLRWANPNSRFSLPELEVGIPIGWGGIRLVAHLIGAHRAKALVYGCETLDAPHALNFGLISQIVDSDADFAQRLQALAEVPPSTLKTTLAQFKALKLGQFKAQDDAMRLVKSANDPAVLKSIQKKWTRS